MNPATARPTAPRPGLLLLGILATVLSLPSAEAARLRAEPARAKVSVTEGAELRVSLDLRSPGESPRAGLVFLAESSFGSISSVEEPEPGLYRAKLRLPPTDMPRAAVVVFSAQEAEHVELHHVVVPVSVTTHLRARTEPRSTVSIQVAGRTFGPVRADRAGWFTLTFTQPPATSAAEVVVVDAAGNVKRQELPVPNRPHDALTVVLDRYRASSDGLGRVRVHALVFDESGRPVPGARIEARSDRGRLSAFVDHGDGVHGAEWTAPADGTEGVASLSFSVGHGGRVHREIERIRIERGGPGRLVLGADPLELVAGEALDVALTVQVQDAAGNGLPDQPVQLSADRGSVDALRELGGGRYESRLRLPSEVGSGSVLVKALLITERPDSVPTRVEVSANPEVVPTSWRAFSLVTATVTDESGSPVAGEVVLFHVARGEGVVTPTAVTNADGRAFADFSADLTEEIVTVEATSTSVPTLKGDTRIEKRASGEFAIVNRPALAARGGSGPAVAQGAQGQVVLEDTVLIALRPGPPANLSVAADPSRLIADGKSGSRVTAVLTDARGNEIPESQIRFSVDAGTIGEGSNVGDGRYLAPFTAPDGAGTGRALVTAVEPVSGLTATTTIELEVGPPSSLVLAIDREELPADGASQAMLTARLEDASGVPVPDASVAWSVEGPEVGLPSSSRTNADGIAQTALTAGHESGSVMIAAEAGEGLRAEVSLELLPTEPVFLRLTAAPESIRADGVEAALLEAQLEDSFGRPVADHPVEFRVFDGPGEVQTAPLRSDSLGIARARLSSLTAGTALVRARSTKDSSLMDEVAVALRPSAIVADFEIEGPACAGAVALSSLSDAALEHEWDWTGDGLADATGAVVTAPLTAGLHRVRLLVRDDSGREAAAEADVEVATPPVATAEAAASHVRSGACVSLDGGASTAADGGALTHEWDLDFDGAADVTGAMVAAWCAEDGERRARLTVRDTNGCTAADEVVVTFGDVPVLSVSIAAPGVSLPVGAGSSFEVELRWANSGVVSALQTVVELQLSSELAVDGALPPGGSDLGGGRLRFPLGDIAAGASGAFPVRLRATTDPALPSSLASALASIRHQTPLGPSSPLSAALSIPIVPLVDLTLSCTAPATAKAGETFELLAELGNEGVSMAHDPSVDLEWDPAELELVSSVPAGTAAASSLRLSWITLAAGGREPVRITFRVRSVLAALVNAAQVDLVATHASAELVPSDNACQRIVEATAEPDAWVLVTATPDRDPARPGDTILYEIEYGNRGSTAAQASVIEGRFDAGIFESSLVENPNSGIFSGSTGTVRFLTGRLPADAARVDRLRYRVRVGGALPSGGQSVRTEVTVRHASVDARPADDLDAVSVSVESAPDLSLSVQLPAGAAAGDTVPVILTTTSTGDVPAEGVIIEHAFAGALAQVVPASLPAGASLLPDGTVRLDIGDLSIGASHVAGYDVRLADVQDAANPTLSNTWTAAFGTPGGRLNRQLLRGLPIAAAPELAVDLQLSTATAAAGGSVEASVLLTASGAAPWPAGSVDLEWTADSFAGTPPTGANFPSLAPGSSRLLGPWTLTVQPILPTTLNAASVTARVAASALADTAAVQLTAAPSLALRVASIPASAGAGDRFDVSVACRNNGTTAATATLVTLAELLGVDPVVAVIEPADVSLGVLPADGVERVAGFQVTLVTALPDCLVAGMLEPRATATELPAAVAGPSASVNAVGEPDLRLELSAQPSSDPPAAGDLISYRLVVTNVGDAPARAATVVLQRDLLLLPDVVPPLPADATIDASQVTLLLGDLPPGGSATRTLRLRVADSLPSPTNRATVVATVSESSCESRTGDNVVGLGLNIGAVADVVVSVEVRTGTAELQAGGSVGVTLYVSNAGSTPAENVELTLEFPPSLVASVDDADGGLVDPGGTVTWSGITLPTGQGPQQRNLSLVLTPQLPSISSLFSLSTRATTTSPENLLDNNLADVTKTVRAWADLCVDLVAEPVPLPAAVSGRLQYLIAVRNQGRTTARGTIVRLDYDASLLTPRGGGGNPLEWTIGDLPPGGVIDLSQLFDIVNVVPGGTAVAVATATAASPEHDAWALALCDARATEETVITDEADLALLKSVSPTGSDHLRGDLLDFTVSVTNVGNADADGGAGPSGTVEDVPPAGLLMRSTGGGNWDGTTLRWDLPPVLRRGESWSATYQMEIDSALGRGVHVLTNAALVLPALTDATAGNDADSVTLELRFDVDLVTTVSCSARPAPAVPGSLLDYDVQVTNRGAYQATGVVLDLTGAPSLRLEAPLSGSSGSLAGPATLAPGASWVTSFSARSEEAYADPLTSLGLTATARANEPDADPATAVSVTSCDIVSSADLRVALSVTESDASPPAEPGELLDVAVVLENVGSRIESNVELLFEFDPALASFANGPDWTPDGPGRLRHTHPTPFDPRDPPVSLSLQLQAVPTLGSPLEVLQSCATASSTGPDVFPSDNVACRSIQLFATPDLRLTRTASTPSVPGLPGEPIDHEVRIENVGTTTASSVVLEHVLDPARTAGLVGGSASHPALEAGDRIEFTVGNLAPGPAGAVTLTYQVAIAGTQPAIDGLANSTACALLAETDAVPADNCASLGAPIFAAPDAWVALRLEPSSGLSAGDGLTAFIDHGNVGTSPLVSAELRLELDPALQLIDAGGGATPGPLVLSGLPAIAPGESRQEVVPLIIADALPAASNLLDVTARILHAESARDASPASDADTVTLSVGAAPDLVVSVALTAPTDPRPGDVLSYRVDWRNDGSTTAPNAVLTLFPDELFRTPGGGAPASPDIRALGDAAPGAAGTIRVDYLLPSILPADNNVVDLIVNAASDLPDAVPADNTALHALQVQARPDMRVLTLAVNATPAPAAAGGLLDVAASHDNHGSTLGRGAELVFSFDDTVATLEDAGGGRIDGPTRVIFDLGDVPVNVGSPAGAGIRLRARDTQAALQNPLVITAEISAVNEPVGLTGDNSAVQFPVVFAEPDLVATISVESVTPDPARCGGEVTLLARFENIGSAAAAQCTLTTSWDPALVESVLDAAGATVTVGSAEWALGPVAPGDPVIERRVVLAIASSLPASSNLLDVTALASSVDSDRDVANNSDTAGIAVGAGVDLVLSASLEPAGPLREGSFVFYTYRLTNVGCTAAVDPCVESPYEADVLRHWLGGQDLGGSVRTCVSGTLAPGDPPRTRQAMFQVVAPGTGEVRRDLLRTHTAFESGGTVADDDNPPDNVRNTSVTACFLDVSITSPSPSTLCRDGKITLVANTNVTTGVSYEWIATNGGTFDDPTAPVVLFTPPTTAGLYPVHLRLTHVSGCTATTETNSQLFPVRVVSDCTACGCQNANLRLNYIPGSLERVDAAGNRTVAPGETMAFRLRVADAGNGKSATIHPTTTLAFSDRGAATYLANLAYSVHFECRTEATLTFSAEGVPVDMPPGVYAPDLIIDSTDACGNGSPRNTAVGDDITVALPFGNAADPGIDFRDWGPRRSSR